MSVAAIDTHFRWVFNRMQTINPARQVLGIMSAQDWPPKQVRFESFYLLILGEESAPDSWGSGTIPVFGIEMQWVWMVMGTDLQSGLVGRNRGDRYRTDGTMKKELRYSLYPGFAPKQTWAVTGNSITSLQLVGTQDSPTTTLYWSRRPTVVTRTDKASGIIYSSAAVRLTDQGETIAA